jgi:streptogramin lyase
MRLFHLYLAMILLLVTAAGADPIRVVSVPANDLVYDPATQKIYASVPGSAGPMGNSLVAIDPETGQVGAPIPVGSEPDRLAIAESGRSLYVVLDGASAVRRFDTVTRAAGRQFPLDPGGGGLEVEDMEVVPGSPDSVAISRYRPFWSPRGGGIVIYDDGVPRPNGGGAANVLAFGAHPDRLYAYQTDNTAFVFHRWTVGAAGIVADSPLLGFLYDLGRITYDNGRLFVSNGMVVDPEAGELLGTLPKGVTRPDVSLKKVFILQGDGQSAQILSYGANSFLPLGSIPFSGALGPVGHLIRWGADGLAFTTSGGQIYLLHTGQLSAQPIPLSVTLSAPAATVGVDVTGTIHLGQPAPPGGLVVTLSTSDPAARVPATVIVPEGATTASFPVTAAPVPGTTPVIITGATAAGAGSAMLQLMAEAPPSGNLLVNGGFEQPNVGATRSFRSGTYGPQGQPELVRNYGGLSIPGWLITRGSIDVIQGNWPAEEGGQSLQLVGSPGAGTIVQSVRTEPGHDYIVSGYLSQTPLIFQGAVSVSLNGEPFLTLVHSAVTTYRDARWAFFSRRFRATSPITTLSFSDVTGISDFKGAALDNLAVTPAELPLPTSSQGLPVPADHLTAQAVSRAEVHLSWADNSNNETGFTIYRQNGGGGWDWLGRVGANVTGFADVDVRPGGTYTYQVRAFNDLGSMVGSDDEATATVPGPVPLPPETLLVSSAANNRVLRYDARTGALIDALVPASIAPRQTQDLVIGPDGTLWVNSGERNYTVRYDLRTGALFGVVIDNLPPLLQAPTGLTVGPDGNVYVSSSAGDQVARFNAGGGFIDYFVPQGSSALKQPFGLRFGPDGNLYVASRGIDSILRYDGHTGQFIDAFVPAGSGGLQAPADLVFGPDGSLYVSSGGSSSILRYDGHTGAFLGAFVPAGSGGLDTPEGLTFGPDGNLYVASTGTNTVIRYDGSTGTFLSVFIAGDASEQPNWLLFAPTPPAPPPPPPPSPDTLAAPTRLGASLVIPTAVQLAWENNSPNADAVAIWRSVDRVNWSRVGVVAPMATSFTDFAISPRLWYYYRVRATRGDVASDWSNEATVGTMAAPGPTTGLTAAAVSPTLIHLTWGHGQDNATATEVYRKSAGGDYARIARIAPTEPTSMMRMSHPALNTRTGSGR